MKVIKDKIPALEKMDLLINEIKRLLGPNNIPFWIAGGAITSMLTGDIVNDYDLFSPNPKKIVEILKQEVKYTTFESKYYANFHILGCDVQVLLEIQANSPEFIFNLADFTVACCAYDGHTLYCHDRFWTDIATKRLVVNKLPYPMKSFKRMALYISRGYTPTAKTVSDIFDAIKVLVPVQTK